MAANNLTEKSSSPSSSSCLVSFSVRERVLAHSRIFCLSQFHWPYALKELRNNEPTYRRLGSPWHTSDKRRIIFYWAPVESRSTGFVCSFTRSCSIISVYINRKIACLFARSDFRPFVFRPGKNHGKQAPRLAPMKVKERRKKGMHTRSEIILIGVAC